MDPCSVILVSMCPYPADGLRLTWSVRVCLCDVDNSRDASPVCGREK